jgi:hypothetical protein
MKKWWAAFKKVFMLPKCHLHPECSSYRCAYCEMDYLESVQRHRAQMYKEVVKIALREVEDEKLARKTVTCKHGTYQNNPFSVCPTCWAENNQIGGK